MSHPLFAVTVTVVLGLVSAILLKEAAARPALSWMMMALFFMGVMSVNAFRFLIWGYVHKRHPISLSYPLGSVFFPLILILSHFYYGEPISTNKFIASLIIMLGVGIIGLEEKDESVLA